MSEFDSDFYQNLLLLIVLIFSYLIMILIFCKNKYDYYHISLIFIWHTFFSLAYFGYTLFNQSDARKYYRLSLIDNINIYPGSSFIYYITSVPTKVLDANYLNATLFFNFSGALGLGFLYLSIKYYLKDLPWYWAVILFVPSMSFWSAGLGKDALSFLATCMFVYAITTSRRAVILVPLAFFLMFMVRPHIAAMMLASYVIYFIIQAHIHIVFKLVTLPIIALALFSSIGFVQQYIGLEDASLNSVTGYIDERQVSNLGGGSSLDIASMSYPMQMFTYIFRPLPFEAHNIVSLVTAIENTALLFIFLYVLIKIKFDFKFFVKGRLLWLFSYAFLTCSILAMTTANLGIATRQKWMFMPVLIYLLVSAYHRYYNNKYRVAL